MQQYRKTLIAEADHEYPLSELACEDLNTLQQMLGLRDEDILPIQQEVEAQFTQQSETSKPYMHEGDQENHKTTEFNELTQLTFQFLEQYSRWFFNAARIRGWGAQQSGYEAFSQYTTNEIDQCLQQLLASNKLRVQTSKQGTTLYAVK